MNKACLEAKINFLLKNLYAWGVDKAVQQSRVVRGSNQIIRAFRVIRVNKRPIKDIKMGR